MQEFAFLLVIMLLIMGGYWSFFVYPRQREFKQRQNYVRQLALGDEVVTFGGVIGRIVDVDGEAGVVLVEVADGVVVRCIAASIVSAFDPEEIAHNARRARQQDESAQA
ncbi:MAG: preprotein translocase subunit YajC [Chloroflexota bacterium]